MLFHPQEFRRAISDSNSKPILHIIKQLLYSLKHQYQPLYLIRMSQEMTGILKSQSQSPILKFKMIMYLIILADTQVLEKISDQIYPLLRNACLFNRSQPLDIRGMDFFRHNKYFEVATFDQKTKIKKISCRYIIFCLECVYMLSHWLPKQNKDKNSHISIFSSSYNLLLKEGVQFPQPNQFTFFNEERLKIIQKEIQTCITEIETMKDKIQDEYYQSGKNRIDVASMNGVQYLQKKLKQRQQIIADMKYKSSMNDLQKQQLLQKIREQQSIHLSKISIYEMKINTLTKEVAEMKELLQNQSKKTNKNQIYDKNIINHLKTQIQLLNYENNQLKQELAKKSYITSKIQSNKAISINSFNTSLPKSKSQQHLKQLYQITNQPNQFNYKSLNKPPQTPELFFQFKNTKDQFYPIFNSLSNQSQIRLRKCLLKSKQILYKNKTIQIGIISSLKNDIEIEMIIIITNLEQNALIIHNIQFCSTKQLTILRKQGSNKKKVAGGQQLKMQIEAIVNNIESKCSTMIMQYQPINQKQVKEMVLILPVSKIKLLKTLSYTSQKSNQNGFIERVFQYQKRILSQINKLKDYLSHCFVQKHINNQQYCFKTQFLQHTFFIRFNQIQQNFIRISITCQQQIKFIAQKLIDQFQFILSK